LRNGNAVNIFIEMVSWFSREITWVVGNGRTKVLGFIWIQRLVEKKVDWHWTSPGFS